MSTLFISDLHLQAEREDIASAFERFMTKTATQADALYILGDLFEVWVGDDDHSEFNLRIIKSLKGFTDQGKKLLLVTGNRDFLLGAAFATACGATLLSETEVIALDGGREAVILHGDSLCTDDEDYMAFRAMARSPMWQQSLLNKPLEERKVIARQLREKSKSMSSSKAEDIMDVNTGEVMNLLRAKQCRLMIHGHTHRPDRHEVTIGKHVGERIVLGDWDTHAWWLLCDNQGQLSLEHTPIAAV